MPTGADAEAPPAEGQHPRVRFREDVQHLPEEAPAAEEGEEGALDDLSEGACTPERAGVASGGKQVSDANGREAKSPAGGAREARSGNGGGGGGSGGDCGSGAERHHRCGREWSFPAASLSYRAALL